MARPSSTDRLVRLLALPAWVAENDGATFDEAAAHFGVTPQTIRHDVETLWVSGLPGGMPGDLVDFSADAFDAGRLSLTTSLGLDRPVRLSRTEAVSLLLSLDVLDGLLGADAGSRELLAHARAALSAAIGGGSAQKQAPEAHDGDGRPAGAHGARSFLPEAREALARGRRLRIRYASATDALSEREVDPIELTADGSHLTLRAWCHTARAERSFRLDRILDAVVLDAPSRKHRPGRTGIADAPGAQRAVLVLEPAGRWIADQLPVDSVERLEDGGARVEVTGRDEDWLVSLILSAGSAVRAVEPEGLAARAAEAGRKALRRYA